MKRTILVLVLFLFSTSLQAQTTGLTGFDLRLFRPPTDGTGLLNLHGSEILEPGEVHSSLVLEQGHGLLAGLNGAGQNIRIVNDLTTANVGLSAGLASYLEVGLNVPVIPFEKGHQFTNNAPFTTASIGDVALDLKFPILKKRSGGLAFLSETTFPTGSTDKFTGYRTVTQEGRLIADKKVGPVYATVNLGYRTLGRTQPATNIDMDDLLTFGSGLAWTLPTKDATWDLMGEIDGARVLRNSGQLTTPIEWLVGVRKRLPAGLTAQVGGGKGITNGVGAGEWRVLAGIEWTVASGRQKLLETIYFRFDQDQYLPKYEPRLEKVAEKIKASPKKETVIRGHADSEGSEKYNLELSRKRAMNVKKLLLKKGVSEKQIRIEKVGEKEPAADNRTFKGKGKNRRVEVLQ